MQKGFCVVFSAILAFVSCQKTPTSADFSTVTWTGQKLTYSQISWSSLPGDSLDRDTTYAGVLTAEDIGDTTIEGTQVKKIQTIQNSIISPFVSDTCVEFVSFTSTGWRVLAYSKNNSSLLFLKRSRSLGDSVIVDDDPYVTLLFPLDTAVVWKTRPDTAVYTTKVVLGREKVTVTAGEFDCLHVYDSLLVPFQFDDLCAHQWYSSTALVKQIISWGEIQEYDTLGEPMGQLRRHYTRVELTSIQ